ncbi:RICIN domain-containing protein [Streptomyces peucetius]|uniref:RICIN domain-containing protein n=1 Tax=Streptomyces peucetius TaxID=1950 RepID=A0ABY6IER9_STRPE|nr:RICIN domain-containing protein [Streptomyces peucetius]UYQ65518.1 RICIN domain-containing protein [Streptomyces peucetius]
MNQPHSFDAYGAHGAHGAHGVDPDDATQVLPPLEPTQTLPRVEDRPARRAAPHGGGRAGARSGARSSSGARSGVPFRSRGVLVAAVIVVCAAAGLGIGAVLGGTGDDEEEARTSSDASVAAQAQTSAAPGPAPTPEAEPEPTQAAESATGEPPVPDGLYLLVDGRTGRAADVEGGSSDDGVPVIVWDFHGGPNQQWAVTGLDGGQVQIRAVHSGKCLQAADPAGPGAAVVQQPCTGAGGQRWALTSDAGGLTLSLHGTGLVLTADGHDAGAPLRLQAPNPAAPWPWTLQPVA